MSASHALELERCFGFNNKLGASVLLNESFFFVSGHTGVVYNYRTKNQQLLIGHVNMISTFCVSSNKKFIVTADSGSANSTMTIWNSETYVPILTLHDIYDGLGAKLVDISHDSKFIATIGYTKQNAQVLQIYEWTRSDSPIHSIAFPSLDPQTCLKFNPGISKELISNGVDTIYFIYFDQELTLTPPAADQKEQGGRKFFSVSAFLPSTEVDVEHPSPGSAVTSTSDGRIIVWGDMIDLHNTKHHKINLTDEEVSTEQHIRPQQTASKILHLQHLPITSITMLDRDKVVLAGEDGFIRIYDLQFRLLLWYERGLWGPIFSLSFEEDGTDKVEDALTAAQKKMKAGHGDAGKDKGNEIKDAQVQKVVLSGFIASTTNGTIYYLKQNPVIHSVMDCYMLLAAQPSNINAAAPHPNKPQFALGGSGKVLQIYDYQKKNVILQRSFEQQDLVIQSLIFSSDASIIAVGFSNGLLKFLTASDLNDIQRPVRYNSNDRYSEPTSTFHISKNPITLIQFSKSNTYAAAGDTAHRVSLIQLMTPSNEWEYIGSYTSHLKPIVALHFDPVNPILYSISEDRSLVEYDLLQSDLATGVKLRNRDFIEQEYKPTASTWYPRGHDTDPFLLIATSGFKFKILNPATRNIRQTTLSPFYEGHGNLKHLVSLDNRVSENESTGGLVAFAFESGLIGITRMPLTGNPFKWTALTAHPSKIVSLFSTFDGKYIVTVGESDYAVHMWSLHPDVLDEQILQAGTEESVFVQMIPGAREGDFYKDLEDYFYYAQLRSQGEDTTKARIIHRRVNLDQVPNIFRAVGFYMTQKQVDNLISEVRYEQMITTGSVSDSVTFEDLIRLYVNHRPIYDITEKNLLDAIEDLNVGHVQEEEGDEAEKLYEKASFIHVLREYGEPMKETSLKTILADLLTDHPEMKGSLPDLFSKRDLIESALGFNLRS